ncbi:C-type lectin lectoxin-Thr1-like [Erythrolamprus reginae]|uniref:C-type lectin lectoxin-Thr1-like n=1 Tax=Erythrolamprus reginae TaxID=121349 RepID=UPI00396C30FF
MGRFIFVSLGLLVVAFSLTGARQCLSDQLSMQRFCYKVFDSRKNWNDAEIFCMNYRPGCHLASIHSAEESTALPQYVSGNLRSRRNVWIGLHLEPAEKDTMVEECEECEECQEAKRAKSSKLS